MKKTLSYKRNKDKTVKLRNELKAKINNAKSITELQDMKTAFEWLPTIAKYRWEDDFNSLYGYIHYKVKRMRKMLKSEKIYYYDMYGRSMDWFIHCMDIYFDDGNNKLGSKLNLNNIDKVFNETTARILLKYKNEKPQKLSKYLPPIDMFKMMSSDLYREKALNVAMGILKNKSEHWWL